MRDCSSLSVGVKLGRSMDTEGCMSALGKCDQSSLWLTRPHFGNHRTLGRIRATLDDTSESPLPNWQGSLRSERHSVKLYPIRSRLGSAKGPSL